MTLAHRVAVMRGGQLQQFDTPMNIYHRPANRFVAEFVGTPGMNFIEGRIDQSTGTFNGRGVAVSLNDQQLQRLKGRERATLGIRSEHVQVVATERDGWLRAVVYVTELMGNETLCFLRLGDEKIIARAPADFRAEMETPVWTRLDMDKADFFDAESGEALR